jgi:hypothetical protein
MERVYAQQHYSTRFDQDSYGIQNSIAGSVLADLGGGAPMVQFTIIILVVTQRRLERVLTGD